MEEYELIIKDINDTIYVRRVLNDKEKAQPGFLKNVIQQLFKDISTQIVLKPQPSFALNTNLDRLLAEIKDSVNLLLPQCFSLQNTINSISMTYLSWNVLFDSKILQNDLERTMVATWISNRLAKFTLLYRGSRDGYSNQALANKLGNIKPTLVLVEAKTNKRFGGFTDQDWIMNETWKASSQSFIFSISDREKYPIKLSNKQHAIHASQNYLMIFGAGQDLSLQVNGNTNTNSSSYFGTTYDNKGKPSDSLAGSLNFQIKELEVYQVETV